MTVRNMFRQGRLLEVAGRLTKIGTGDPLDFGLDDTFLCNRLRDDPIGSSKLQLLVHGLPPPAGVPLARQHPRVSALRRAALGVRRLPA